MNSTIYKYITNTSLDNIGNKSTRTCPLCGSSLKIRYETGQYELKNGKSVVWSYAERHCTGVISQIRMTKELKQSNWMSCIEKREEKDRCPYRERIPGSWEEKTC